MITYDNIGQNALGRWMCFSAILMCLAGCGFQLKGSDAASSSAKLEGMTLQLISSQPRSELTRDCLLYTSPSPRD